MAHNPEVAGSNPAPATRQNGPGEHHFRGRFLLLVTKLLVTPTFDRCALRPGLPRGSPASSSSCCASPTGHCSSAATPEARPRRPFNEQEATLSNQRRRRPAPRSLLCGTFAARAGCRPANVSRAQPTPVTMKRGDHLPTRVLDGTPGRQQLGGVGDKTRIIEPPEVLALSPERGGAPDRCGGS